jgi:hypothetical protein
LKNVAIALLGTPSSFKKRKRSKFIGLQSWSVSTIGLYWKMTQGKLKVGVRVVGKKGQVNGWKGEISAITKEGKSVKYLVKWSNGRTTSATAWSLNLSKETKRAAGLGLGAEVGAHGQNDDGKSSDDDSDEEEESDADERADAER